MTKKDGKMYDLLTSQADMAAGLYAFEYYMEEKKNYIEEFKKNNSNRNPTEKDLNVFYCDAEHKIKDYYKTGTRLSTLYYYEKYRKDIRIIEESYTQKVDSLFSNVYKSQSKWRGFLPSIIASIVAAIIISLSSYVYYKYSELKALMAKEIVEKVDVITPGSNTNDGYTVTIPTEKNNL